MSLRDVERCMIVFEYFFGQIKLFDKPMNDKATEEKKTVNMLFKYDDCIFILTVLLQFIAAIGRSCISFSYTGLKCLLSCQAARQN